MNNPILEELHRIRDAIAARCGYDPARILEESNGLGRALGHDVVTLSPSGEIIVLYKAPERSAEEVARREQSLRALFKRQNRSLCAWKRRRRRLAERAKA